MNDPINQEDADKLLRNAVEQDDLAGVQFALSKGANAKKFGSVNLVDASWMGHTTIAEVLIPLSDARAYREAIFEAAINGHTSIVDMLLDVCQPDDASEALGWAAYHGRKETVDFLYDKCDADAALSKVEDHDSNPCVVYLRERRQSEIEALSLQSTTTKVVDTWSPSPQESSSLHDCLNPGSQSDAIERTVQRSRMRL